MGCETWKALHGRGRENRPGLAEILAFLPDGAGALFQEFSRRLAREYNVGCKPPTYTETDGWVYAFGRYDVHLIGRVTMEDGAFGVQGLRVGDEESLRKALELADSLYGRYQQRLEQSVAEKKERQKLTTQRRAAREQGELDAMAGQIDKEKFNRFRWSPKLSRQTLKRLYESDAKGIPDEELLDEVGYALYARCLQGRDERRLMEVGRLRCHGCGAVLQARSMGGLMACPCGQQYQFREYMRAFRTENMPSGAATATFNAFLEDWPRARGYAEKMRLVDALVHEFHTNLQSGVKGRFVGVNLIAGTKKQIEELILELAYGGSAEQFAANLRKE